MHRLATLSSRAAGCSLQGFKGPAAVSSSIRRRSLTGQGHNSPCFPLPLNRHPRGVVSTADIALRYHSSTSGPVDNLNTVWIEKLRTTLLQESSMGRTSPRAAQHLWEEQQKLAVKNSSDSKNDQKLAAVAPELFDAWIRYQNNLLASYHNDHPDLALFQEMYEAAEQAQALLEQMYPCLAAKQKLTSSAAPVVGSSSSRGSSSTTDDSLESDNRERKSARNRSPVLDADATARCNQVLAAWLAVVKAERNVVSNSSWSSSSSPLTAPQLLRGVPQRAQLLLERMEESSQKQPTQQQDMIMVRPTVDSYNLVMEAWAYSKEHLRGQMAERIFQRLVSSSSSSTDSSTCMPNGGSYKAVLWAWALSRERRAAFTATGHLMAMLRHLEGDKNNENNNDDSSRPELDDFRVVLEAWTLAEDQNSPAKAMSVLKLMDHAVSVGTLNILPDQDCYLYILMTAANRPLLPNTGLLVDDILNRMKERFMVPNTACFGAAIRTYKNRALNPELVEYRDASVSRALALLAEMRVAHHQSMSVSVQPTTTIINDVLEVLSLSSNPRRMEQAEHLLEEMEDAIVAAGTTANHGPTLPDADSYRHVINVWKTVRTADKVPQAKAILLRMTDKYNDLRKLLPASQSHAFVSVFNAFMAVCASTNVGTEEKGLEVLKEALSSLEILRNEMDGLEPNAETYATLLEACEKLLAPGKERRKFIETAFRLCCGAGMVNGTVLLKLQSAANSEQYQKLVVAHSEDVEGMKIVPEAWTISALSSRRVITADGRRARPLSVEGELVTTTAMREFQMRRLKDKRNRNLLRGGRLPKVERGDFVAACAP